MLSMHDEDWIEDRIRWKASRYNLPSAGQMWEMSDVPVHWHDRLRAIAEEHDAGTPVLVFLGDNVRWTLVGTRKVVSLCHGSLAQCPLSELERVRRGEQPAKVDLECLELKLRGREDLAMVWAPRGDALFALWSVLEMFCRTSAMASPGLVE